MNPRESLAHFYEEKRPWGGYRQYTLNEPSSVKLLDFAPNGVNSLQTHTGRGEYWVIVGGGGAVTVGGTVHEVTVGDEVWIGTGVEHRMKAGVGGCTALEVSFGHFDEADIVRLADEYGRV
jgi:mannose-6-phosphate isomerase